MLDINGGMVAQKTYDKTYSKIYGYGRPNYTLAENNTNKTVENVENSVENSVENVENSVEKYSQNQFVKDIQRCIGAKVGGIAGKETMSKTITISTIKNRKHNAVRYIQKMLKL